MSAGAALVIWCCCCCGRRGRAGGIREPFAAPVETTVYTGLAPEGGEAPTSGAAPVTGYPLSLPLPWPIPMPTTVIFKAFWFPPARPGVEEQWASSLTLAKDVEAAVIAHERFRASSHFEVWNFQNTQMLFIL